MEEDQIGSLHPPHEPHGPSLARRRASSPLLYRSGNVRAFPGNWPVHLPRRRLHRQGPRALTWNTASA